MLTKIKLAHILLPLALALLYLNFILFLNRYFIISIILVVVETLLLIFYAIGTYALLHVPPKIVQREINGKNSLELNNGKIFCFKKNQERFIQLKSLLAKKDKKLQKEQIKEYIQLYQEPSYCDICQTIKPPRAHHCEKCNKCISRREKHSELINGCIGEGNMKTYIQYMLISIILSGYMIITLIVISIGEHHQLNDFSETQLCLFAFQEMVLCSWFILSVKQFFISYYHIVQNITQTQIDQGIISLNNPFKKQKYYQKMFHSKLDYLKINKIGDFNHWLQIIETN